MSQELNIQVHVPGQENIELPFHVNLDIFVWSQYSKLNTKKIYSTLVKRFPHRTVVKIPEDLVSNLKQHLNLPNVDMHFIRLNAVVSRHPSGEHIASTYRLVVIRQLPFAEEEKSLFIV